MATPKSKAKQPTRTRRPAAPVRLQDAAEQLQALAEAYTAKLQEAQEAFTQVWQQQMEAAAKQWQQAAIEQQESAIAFAQKWHEATKDLMQVTEGKRRSPK